MTETFYRTGSHKVDHTRFGGYVYESDFNEFHSMSMIAEKIAKDFSFDKKCKENLKYREQNRNHKKGRFTAYGKY